MSRHLTKAEFTFTPVPFGRYKVVYTSAISGIRWENVTDNVTLVNAVRNADSPNQGDLSRLRTVCKSGWTI